MATKAEVAMALAHLAPAYPETPLVPEMVQAYAEDLAEYSAEFVLRAAQQLRRTSKWFPKIPEFRELADELQRCALEAERTKRILLDTGRADSNDPRVLEAKAAFAKLGAKYGVKVCGDLDP